MSRIGRKPIVIPAGVTVTLDGQNITVKGPKGTLNSTVHPLITVTIEGSQIDVTRKNDDNLSRSVHGLSRTLISNMVDGVTVGFTKALEVQGVGYRVAKQGKDMVMTLGYSHPVIVSENEDIQIEVPDPNKIIIHGIDKQKVGQFAAEVREKRPPEPYKGKGVRYVGEYVAHKEGKAGKGAK
ncbi:MAG: 50S ribosomal protein L6 [Oscillospiraceae bacterium]